MKYLISFLLFVLFIYGCSPAETIETLDTIGTSQVFYANSFETPEDTAGWTGYCSVQFSEDVPIDGGLQSIAVSCGCIAPHVLFSPPKATQAGSYIISCQAKGSGLGGFIALKSGESEITIPISGQDSTWQYYQSTDTLYCPAEEDMQVHLSAGGIAGGTILVDLLEIKTVN